MTQELVTGPARDDAARRGGALPSMAALGLVSATGPFSTDTYLAALPALRNSLGTTASAAQLIITTCIIGLAIGLFAGGTLSDVLGRRPASGRCPPSRCWLPSSPRPSAER